MLPHEIKKLRMQSVLKEILPSAFGILSDPILKGLCVVDVECKRGQYDAFIYLDKMYLNTKEQTEVLTKLKKVSRVLQDYCLGLLGTYRCPKFHFKFDESLERQNKIEDIFKQIKKEKND